MRWRILVPLGLGMVVVLGALFLRWRIISTDPESVDPRPIPGDARSRPGSPEPPGQEDESIQADTEPITSSGAERIRIRREDGTADIVRRSSAAFKLLEKRFIDGGRLFDRAEYALYEDFEKVLKAEGAPAAWRFLESYLRDPEDDAGDVGRVHRAIHTLELLLQPSRSAHPNPEAFAQLEFLMKAKMTDLLGKDRSPFVQKHALSLVIGQPQWPDVTGPNGVLEDGLWTYDENEPVVPRILIRPLAKSKDSIPNPLLTEPSFADSLLEIFRDPDRQEGMRMGALLGIAFGKVRLGSLDLVRIVEGDQSPGVREAAMDILTVHPELYSADSLVSMLRAQPDAGAKSKVMNYLGAGVLEDPAMTWALTDAFSSPNPARSDPDWRGKKRYVITAIELSLDRYTKHGSSETFSLLTTHMNKWATWEAGEGSPLAYLANQAAERKLHEFAPFVRSALESVPQGENRQDIQWALEKMESH